jgi:hypothetical protein
MKGTIHKLSKGWTIWYNEDHIGGNVAFVDSLPTHPYQKFDQSVNGSEVEFEIEDFWETGLEESIKVANVKELIKVTIKKDSESAKAFESLRQEKKEFKENVQSGKIMPPHIKEKIDKLTDELKKIYELAEEHWEGCDGCDENDKNFFIKGFQAGYNTAKPDGIPRLMYKDGREIRSYHSPILDELLKETSDEEALRLAKEMNKQPMIFVPYEISDEEIENAWTSYQRECLEKFEKDTTISGYAITNKEKFTKWYREQLKNK